MVAHSLPGIYTQYLIELVKRWGVTSEQLLYGSGFTLESLSDPQVRIPLDIAVKHLERARTLTGEPALEPATAVDDHPRRASPATEE